MKKILLYGFEPFDNFESNITQDIINKIKLADNYNSLIFKVEFKQSMFESALESIKPTHILGLGQSSSGNKLRIESKAVNAMAKRDEQAICIEEHKQADRYCSWKLPLEDICETSDDAGTYVCNYSMWLMSKWAEQNNADFAFIHIPYDFDLDIAIKYIKIILD